MSSVHQTGRAPLWTRRGSRRTSIARQYPALLTPDASHMPARCLATSQCPFLYSVLSVSVLLILLCFSLIICFCLCFSHHLSLSFCLCFSIIISFCLSVFVRLIICFCLCLSSVSVFVFLLFFHYFFSVFDFVSLSSSASVSLFLFPLISLIFKHIR